ncbi:DUF3857 domain-containing protein [Sphingobium sp. BYY-5]|uniref:DUF3857 domain-containing transglutaminase family protein n=1 Tax=Sphingobium sp. BYY-5 TaxID=2926400 RepID=UPI001FA6FC77|nr:DUF3857 domain-containing transglutaminase family protein [Sphingobium sp. BYY-5]MCI4589616.1 DUF3857 domain-containing protein [Sphingobium sp. BYY-5]
MAAPAALMAGVQAHAGELPLYQPAPAWVEKASVPKLTTFEGEPPMMILFDSQQRIEQGRLWSYVDFATRAGSAEALGQLSSMTLPWAPDKGDLIIHELSILRGDQVIDVLASGKTFSVLRREENLEAREITGILTATMAVEGVQVGDIVRVRYSTTLKDAALAGHVQGGAPLFAAPLRIGQGRFRVQWDERSGMKWRLLAKDAPVKQQKKGGFSELTIALPLVKQPEMPDDAPLRYRHPPLFELSTFASWADVSKTMSPLYATEGLIAPDSPLATELARLKALPGSPRDRAAAALQLVQDHIRYLAIGMDGGNYTPQTPAQTWTLRYGDCKAKTLLLLALLRGIGIEAEPVLASATAGDFVSSRLPSVAAFNHVLVRAVIDGKPLWLDGTGSGTRIDDLDDTPAFGSVLPVRSAGADLMLIQTHPNARPMIDILIDADESGSVKLPSVFDATAVLRGPMAAMINVTLGQLDAKQRTDMVRGFFTQQIGTSQFSDVSAAVDKASATVTLKAHGITTTPWRLSDNRYRRAIGRAVDSIQFSPDRGKPVWSDIPVANPAPAGMRYRLKLRLPDGGKGYTLEGDQSIRQTIAGYDVRRSVQLNGGLLDIDERVDTTGTEIPAVQVPDERDRLATAVALAPRLIAPAKPIFYWDMPASQVAQWPQVKRGEAAFTKAIAEDPDEATGYSSRASFRWAIGDYKNALGDIDKAIGIAPDLGLHLQRAGMRFKQGDLAGALADARKARQFDPSSFDAISAVATYLAESGKINEAVTMVDQRITIGGETRDAYRSLKASLLGTYGDATQAVELLDAHIAEKPGLPTLLNERCWIKGTRNIMLDSAIGDCTRAIELSRSTIATLDSRAMVWFRLGKYDDALRDLDGVITEVPGQEESLFMRGVVLHRLGRAADGDVDLAVARRIDPRIDATYARFGIKP